MNVLSLFDGISCGRVALDNAGIPIDHYYASEIDKYAIKVTQCNHPDTIQLGDVSKIHYMDRVLCTPVSCRLVGDIDIVMFGSPCQSFSVAGKMHGMATMEGEKITNLERYLALKNDGVEFIGQSYLFWEAVRLLNEIKPTYFFMENVVMKKEWMDIISETLGVEPILIDSSLVSAATRKRLYWTNIPNVKQPEDMHITFGDIRERNVPEGSIYYSEKAMDWIHRHEKRTGKKLRIIKDNEKMQMLEASMHKKYSSQRFFGIQDEFGLRYITPVECERCMNLPDNYTAVCSNTQRYKQLGNGWEVNTITHIFKALADDLRKRGIL